MRVFLDTNVLVSAFATRGLSADLFELVIVEHDLITGRQVLKEFERVLRTKLRLPASRCAEVVEYLASEAAVVVDQSEPIGDADEDDRRVLGEAVAGDAAVFVTGDAALVGVKTVGSMRILTPRQLWESLRSDE